MKWLALAIFAFGTFVPCVRADSFQVTSGFITTNSTTSGGSWTFSGNGFTFTGSGLVGICGDIAVAGQFVNACGNGAIIGGGVLNGVQGLSVDGFYSFIGAKPIFFDGTSLTLTEPVSYSGLIVGCSILCPGPTGEIIDEFSLAGDVGFVTITLAPEDNGTGQYDITSRVFTISTPEPGMIVLAGIGLAGLALHRRFA